MKKQHTILCNLKNMLNWGNLCKSYQKKLTLQIISPNPLHSCFRC